MAPPWQRALLGIPEGPTGRLQGCRWHCVCCPDVTADPQGPLRAGEESLHPPEATPGEAEAGRLAVSTGQLCGN